MNWTSELDNNAKRSFGIRKSFIYLHPLRRNGRVVECGSLENCWGSHLRGFESLFLRDQAQLCSAWKNKSRQVYLNGILFFLRCEFQRNSKLHLQNVVIGKTKSNPSSSANETHSKKLWFFIYALVECYFKVPTSIPRHRLILIKILERFFGSIIIP